MRTLPRNITAHPMGLIVRVERLGVTYRAFVSYSFGAARNSAHGVTAACLARAVELRDGFLRIAGEVNRHRVKGHSNTGWAGISELTKWRRSIPYTCFCVTWREHGRQRMRQFNYGPRRTRERARAQAIAWRERVTGLTLNPQPSSQCTTKVTS